MKPGSGRPVTTREPPVGAGMTWTLSASPDAVLANGTTAQVRPPAPLPTRNNSRLPWAGGATNEIVCVPRPLSTLPTY
ncbi:hypothetical protein [Streptomyces sp. BPTC-684]|uniref:hypothetical protein n=1 Tax=Streptomyces sp. BPTC-684 TaxID=3043734 RepID=UPI0024B1ED76|nr:hypothetical protein [Streptomyces sp. BPTC-684]WHM40595.1 hypothetical protein QIY60_29485 [Streptomyces sp. BPTC-684]